MNSISITEKIQESIERLPELDAEILEEYLRDLQEHSRNTALSFIRGIMLFYECVGRRSIRDCTIADIETYIKTLKAATLKRSSKKTMFNVAKTWHARFVKRAFAHGQQLVNFFQYIDNPFLEDDTERSGTGYRVDLESKKTDTMVIPLDYMDKILADARARDYRVYLFLLILKYTGMRASEAITIRIENIDINERIIASGTVKNYAKTGEVIYFTPRHVMDEIENYKLILTPGETWLFPSNKTGKHITCWDMILRRFQREAGLHFRSHQFRHSLITRRDQMGCPGNINELLNNHALTGTQARVYREKNYTILDRRSLYDRYNPYDKI